jgi:hypothetical protein
MSSIIGHKVSEATKQKISKAHMGMFRGETYGSIHNWLIRHFIKEKCDMQGCKSKSFLEFALKKGCKHSHNRDNYFVLCSSHHKKYDYTNERRKKLSESLKKVPHTEIWGKRIGKANKGRKLSKEHRKEISIYQKLSSKTKKRDEKGKFCS